ncbi:MAG: SurA N-terminal domain-containing protein, partial [Desulfobacterales bacterium]|nr:SurA N-terminal domain-containing protein [Desulfobacterales bacterium]
GRITQARQVVDRIVAVVNNDVIRLRELNRNFAQVKEQIKSQNMTAEKLNEELYQARMKVLDRMIEDTLAEQKVEEAGIKVSESQVDAAIENIKARNNYTEEDLRRALQMQGMTMELYRGEIKRQMMRSRLVNRKIKSNIVITNEDIRNYYEAHPEKYGAVVKYQLRNILMNTDPGLAGSEEETRKSMESVLEKLEAGVSFEKLARRYSEAPNASDGGALGKFGLEDLSDKIREAVNRLEKGEYSGIVETGRGLQIFYVEDIVKSEPKPLESVSDKIHDKLYKQRVNEKYEAWIKSLREDAHIRIIR